MDTKKTLNALKKGNQRFVDSVNNEAGALSISIPTLPSSSSQSPSAVVISCSDSRVPPELIFASGLGEIFVVRVAGNIVTQAELGSVEFACQNFGTRLVIVLGHTNCGAIAASIAASQKTNNGKDKDSDLKNITVLIDEINPAIESALNSGKNPESENFHEQVEDANVQLVVDSIISRSSILKSISDLKIVGAKYNLESGRVAFFD